MSSTVLPTSTPGQIRPAGVNAGSSAPSSQRNVASELERLRARHALQVAHRRRTGRPIASPATNRATQDAWRQAATRVSKMRLCQDDPDSFMLPDPPSLAASTEERVPAATFAELAAERRFVKARIRVAKSAIAACHECPLLQQCRREVLEEVKLGRQPTNTVVAATAWNSRGLPDMHIHDPGSNAELEHHTLDVLAGTKLYRNIPDISWIPADLDPVPTIDEHLVSDVLHRYKSEAALKELPKRFVTQSLLDRKPKVSADGRAVITYGEEREIVRRAVKQQMVPNTLATILGCGWDRAADLLCAYGGEVQDYTPGPQAARHRDLFAARERDTAARKQRIRDAQAAMNSTGSHRMSA